MHRQQVKKRMFLEFADKGDKVSHILWKSYKYRPEPSGSATLGNQPFMAQISVHLPNNPIARLPHAHTGALLVRRREVFPLIASWRRRAFRLQETKIDQAR